MGDGSITLSGIVCLEDDRLTLLWVRARPTLEGLRRDEVA